VRAVYLFFSTLLIVVLVTGIAYTTVHLQKETRTILGVAGRGFGRLFGFIRALEEESARTREESRGGPDERPSGGMVKPDDEHEDSGGEA
jgi:hypothetical protein